jgi:hypothetical protein
MRRATDRNRGVGLFQHFDDALGGREERAQLVVEIERFKIGIVVAVL